MLWLPVLLLMIILYWLEFLPENCFDQLIESIHKNRHDERKIIVVDENNILLDGQHRACVLADMYGVDSYIKVLKIWDIKKMIRRFLSHR